MTDLFNWVATRAGRPWVILGVCAVIAALYAIHLAADAINLSISIASLVLSLMILGKQEQTETRDKTRDEALHAKIDELISCTDARDEFQGLEERGEEEVRRVKGSGEEAPES